MNARLCRDPRPPREINPALTPQVQEIILHSLEWDPENRYPSAAAMKAELDAPESIRVGGRIRKAKPVHNLRYQVRRAAMGLFIAAMPFIVFFLFFLMMQHQSAKR